MEKYLKDIIEKQNENIEQIRDVMLWRTNKFKEMVVEWEMANEKVKAMDNHLTNYILDSDKMYGKSIERRDTKIEEQAKRIKELEERVGRIDELTNEVYGEGSDYPARFTLNNVVYFEDERGCFMIAENTDEATILTVPITHQKYIDSLNQYLKQD
jgi:hypothetical protein